MFDMGTVAATERIVPPQRNEITIEVITPEKKAGGNGSALRPRSEGLSCEEKHFVRGRLRIGVPPLAGRRDLLDRLGKYVATLPGVRSVDASGLCNQLTVGYDHQVIRKTDIIGTIEAMTVGDLEKLTDEALAAAAAPAEEEKDVRQTVPQEVCYLEKNEAIAASRLACIPIHSMKGRLRIAVPLLATYEGMAESLREWLLARPGVTEVSSNYRCGSFTIQYEAQITKSDEILRALDDLTVGDLAAMRAELPPKVIEDQDISFSYFKTSTFAMGLSLVVGAVPAIAFGVIYPILVSVSIPVFIRAYRCLKNERRFNVDFLDAAALTAAMLTGDVINASAMVWLIHLGDNIRDRTASSSQRTIRKLLDFQDNYAWVVRDKVEVQIRVRDIVEGDVVALHVGNLIPVDGEVLEGELIVDQQVLTGESMPVCKEVGDTVLASTVIRDGKAYVKVLRTGDKTKVAQVVRAVEEAPVYETKIQNHAEKMADRLVFPSLVLTTLVFLPTLNLYHLAAMLTVDFGTGIRVSAPTAVLSSMIAAVSQGILIKGGSYLEKLCQVDTIVFDKTGTLTTGVIKVEDTFTFNGYAEDELLAFAATAELQMTHPIAQAVVNHAEERGLALKQRDDVKYCVGRGVDAQIEGKRIMVGSLRLLREDSIEIDPTVDELTDRYTNEGKACLYVSIDKHLCGIITFKDQIRKEAKAVIDELHKVGVKQVIMLTGDVKKLAVPVAQALGIDRCIAEVLPQEKADVIIELKKEGKMVAFVGDGINDSVALSYADIGISVKSGADITKETAGVILLDDNLHKIPKAFEISKETISLIKQNYTITGVFNVFAYGVAILNLMSPVVTTLISNGSAVVACLNGMKPIIKQKFHSGTAKSVKPLACAKKDATLLPAPGK